MNSRLCLFLLVGLLGAILAGCGGDEPAPAPPPPPPPPPPAFVPVDVSIELGTSGETLTLQTTESGGFTRNGEAFASGTTVEAAGNNYRLVLADGEWAAEYVAPRPWVTALGRSGDAVLITRAENGSYEVGEGDDKKIFASGGTLTASNGNQYRMTLNAETNAWEVEYLPPDPRPVLLGTSGATVLVHRTEGGTYTVNDIPVVDGSNVPGHSNYRLSMQDGVWTATFVPPPPVMVALGDSGRTVTLQVREDGQFEKDGQLYPSGSRETVEGFTYRLELQNGMWTAEPEQRAIMVTLGMSGRTVTILEHPDGRFTNADGQNYPSGSTETVGGRTYRLELQDGRWTAEFVEPVIVVPLGRSGEFVTLMLQENGTFERDGREFQSNTIVQAGEDRYRLVLRDGEWQATFEAPAEVVVRLGQSGESVTLVRQEGGTYTRDGEPFRPNTVVPAGGSNYRVVFQNGEWSARYEAERIPVLGVGDDLIILFRQEDGSVTYNNETVVSDDIVQVGSTNYRLTYLRSQDRWVAERTSGTTPGDVRVSLPNGETITLTRSRTGTFTYDDRTVSTGSQVTVDGNRYTLTQASDGTWTARAVSDSSTIDTGGIAGPTQTDTVNTFTDARFDDDVTDDDGNTYGVKLSTRGEPIRDADDRGTKIVPQRGGTAPAGASHVEFPVYDLMQQGLVERERTYVEAARAKLREIIDVIKVKKEGYARDVGDATDDISDKADTGLWAQAEMAVGKIFGLTTDAEYGEIFGTDHPWTGNTIDLEEVDEVIEALEDAIVTLSDVGRFGREFEDQIDTINGGTDGDITTEGDNLDTKLDASDFFNGLMSRIRFGSTSNTRFGAYVVKNADADAPAESDAARGGWTRGVFAYTPSDEPTATEIPDRGEATYRGSTVAVSEVPTTNGTVQDGNRKGAKLYAGKIELVASFTRKNVKGTITELKDESGRTWMHNDGFGNEDVKSIVLPDAELSETSGEDGFYQESEGSPPAGAPATAIFADTSLRNATWPSAKFRVQLVEDADEALGVWEAFNLEGAFGATRTGTVSKPTLPSEVDRGGGVMTGTIHHYTNSTLGSGAGPITTVDPEESLFSLTRSELGIATSTDAINDDEFARDFTDLKLTDLYRKSRTVRSGTGFVSEARTRISRLTSGLTDTNLPDRDTAAETIVTSLLGFTKAVDSSDVSTFRSEISQLSSALGSATRLHRAVTDADGYLTGLASWDLEQTRQVYSEKRWDFKYDFGRNKYTRFGVWSQIAPENAAGNVDGSTTDDDSAPHHGSFAYSPLRPAGTDDVALSFAATYEGRTLAVNESTGDLYAGQFILRVNWDVATPSVRTTITDLRGVRGTSDYFKYGTKDVKSIFFTGLTAAAGTLGGTVVMSVRYRGSSQDTPVETSTTAAMSGNFVMDQDFTDEPVGVLGVWRITDTGTMVDDYSASFGAELKP